MRFAPIKSVEQQAVLVMHRVRSVLVRQRTMMAGFRAKLRTLGFEVIGKGPDAMRRRIADEVSRYRDIIARAGIERV